MNCKRLLIHGMTTFLLAFALVAGMIVSPIGVEEVKAYQSWSDTLEDGEAWYENLLVYKERDGSIMITYCREDATTVTIPGSIDGKIVTDIYPYVFSGCSSLTSVGIPSSVTSIGGSAFYGCTSLKDVYYGGSKEQWNKIEISTVISLSNGKNGNEYLTSATIHCTDGDIVRVQKIAITLNGQPVSGTLKAKVGKSYSFKAVVEPANVSEANRKITWSSSDTKVAKVNQNGKVTIKKAGNATITAKTADGISASVKLKASAKAVKVSKVKITSPTGKKTMKVKEKLALTLTVTPATADNTKVTWSSSDKKVATVNKNGKVTAKKMGTVTITATAKDGSGKKATIKIKVKK